MRYGAILRACRERMGLSQEEMAFRLNRSQGTISKLEKDKVVLDMDTAREWADVTGAKEVLVAFICGVDGVSIMQNIMNLVGLGG